MISQAKDLAVRGLAVPWVARLMAASVGPRCVVIMMHRFTGAEGDRCEHDLPQLRRVLSGLRKARIDLLEVDAAIDAFRDEPTTVNGTRAGGLSVAFTIDDGHLDAYHRLAPVFAEFDCPVTCFVAPAVVNGLTWYWWDKVDYLLREAARQRVEVEMGGERLVIDVTDADRRALAHRTICDRLKQLPSIEIDRALEACAHGVEVSLPVSAPESDAVMSWDEMRAAESAGWRFGAHTMTHPVLSRCSDEQAVWEVGESARQVAAKLARPSRVFCYPVGRTQDFGLREQEAVRRAGLDAAVCAMPGVLRRREAHRSGADWFLKVPRVSYDERLGGIQRLFLS